ncbi:MAG: HigA family addiction module antidote protein [Eggerthellaceae bacterium]|nr:HigA family addiction module antidote protein [Eggerthellaceae bacterium]
MRNYAVAPGEYLAEWMEEHPYVTQAQLAERVGVSRKHINEVLNAKSSVSSDVALRLDRVTGIPANAWLLYQAQYDADCARLSNREELAKYEYYISDNLGAYLRQVHATEATRRNPGQLVSDYLDFVRCGTLDAFVRRCEVEIVSGFEFAALRESSKSVDPAALLAWIAQAEKQDADGRRFESDYSASKLLDVIPLVRRRSLSPDMEMLADMRTILEDDGVTILYCAPPKNFPLHGVTYWVEGAPVVVFSERRKKDGYITWAVFRELGHVLGDERGGDTYGLAKPKKQQKAEEKAANDFAKETLFGESGLVPFHGLTRSADIRRVAMEVGVAPGVAVAAMHKNRMLPYNRCNDLLVDVAV